MVELSARARAWLARSDTEVRPWSRDDLGRLAEEHGGLSEEHVRFEEALYEATGRRGLPVLRGYLFGASAAASAGGAPLWRDEYEVAPAQGEPWMSGRGELVAWSKDRGGVYLYPKGPVVHPESSLIIESGIAPFVEQLVLLASHPWIPIRMVLSEQRGEDLARGLDLPWLVEASDEARFVWASDDVLVFQETYATEVYFAALSAMPRVLSICAELGSAVRIESDLPSEIVNASQRRIASASVSMGAQYRVTHRTTLIVRCDAGEGVVVQASVNGDVVLEEATFTATRAKVWRYLPASGALEGRVSRRVIEYCDAERVFRDPARTADRSTLGKLLASRGLRESPALFDLEEQCGGILQEDAADPGRRPRLLMGIFQILTAPEKEQQRWRRDLGESLQADAWPWVSYAGKALVLVGDYAHSGHLYMDEQGAIYTFHAEIDRLIAAAASGLGFLEQFTADWELRRRIPEFADTILDVAVGDRLAGRLSLERLEDASDAVRTHWRNATYWVRQYAEFPPNRPETRIAGMTAEAVVKAVRAALELAPNASVRVVRQPGGRQRFDALVAGGIRARFSG